MNRLVNDNQNSADLAALYARRLSVEDAFSALAGRRTTSSQIVIERQSFPPFSPSVKERYLELAASMEDHSLSEVPDLIDFAQNQLAALREDSTLASLLQTPLTSREPVPIAEAMNILKTAFKIWEWPESNLNDETTTTCLDSDGAEGRRAYFKLLQEASKPMKEFMKALFECYGIRDLPSRDKLLTIVATGIAVSDPTLTHKTLMKIREFDIDPRIRLYQHLSEPSQYLDFIELLKTNIGEDFVQKLDAAFRNANVLSVVSPPETREAATIDAIVAGGKNAFTKYSGALVLPVQIVEAEKKQKEYLQTETLEALAEDPISLVRYMSMLGILPFSRLVDRWMKRTPPGEPESDFLNSAFTSYRDSEGKEKVGVIKGALIGLIFQLARETQVYYLEQMGCPFHRHGTIMAVEQEMKGFGSSTFYPWVIDRWKDGLTAFPALTFRHEGRLYRVED